MSSTLIDEKVIFDNLIYQVITGSKSYGTDIKKEEIKDENGNVIQSAYESDEDKKAIAILPLNEVLKVGPVWETTCLHNPDIEVHSLWKFLYKAKDCNPTLIEMLFTDERFVTLRTPYSDILRENRSLFLSQRCIYSFGGYAYQQLLKIKNALGMDKQEETEKTKHLNHALNHLILSFNDRYDDFGVKIIKKEDDKLYVRMNGDIPIGQYLGMLSEMDNCYRTYDKINHRNKKRDVEHIYKHAMHLIRTLLYGIEICETGNLEVYNTKYQSYLKDIRNQKYTLEEVFVKAERLKCKLDSFIGKECAILPKVVDSEKIDKLYYQLQTQYNIDKKFITL